MSETTIRRDENGLPNDPFRLAEELFMATDGENPRTLAELLRSAKADMDRLKSRYVEYRDSKGDLRSENAIRRPDETVERFEP